MSHNVLEYSLVDGYIQNWLVAGPAVLPLPDEVGNQASVDEAGLAGFYDQPIGSPPESPVDRAKFELDGLEHTWRYYRSLEDHQLDLSAQYSNWGIVRAWTYVQLSSQVEGPITMELSSPGPVQMWMNGSVVGQTQGDQDGLSRTFQVNLQNDNELFIRFDAVSWGMTKHSLSVKLVGFKDPGSAEKVVVKVPTSARFPHRHKIFEDLLDKAYLEHFVNFKGDLINIRWAEDAEMTTSYTYLVRDEKKQNFLRGNADVKTEATNAGHIQRFWERPYHIALQATGREYWDQSLRYERCLPFWVLDTAYANKPAGSYSRRRREALDQASRREPDLYAEIAKMTADRWERIEWKNVLDAAAQITPGLYGSAVRIVGLLGMLYRYQEHESFHGDVVKPVERAVQDFSFAPLGVGFQPVEQEAQSQIILACTAAVLAGQRYPRRVFKKVDLNGSQLRQTAEKQAVEWLQKQGKNGLTAWSSTMETERIVVALAHLTSLAENQMLRELSAVVLDKVLFMLAVNTHQGAFAAAQERSSANAVKSAQLSATVGIIRLLFGTGVFNSYTAGTVSLAYSDYEYPAFFAEMASNPPAELEHKEHTSSMDGDGANLVTYRTPEYILSSVQDYKPGQAGTAEHVWQATLGPDAILYTNHPGGMGEQEGLTPGFWLGNASLPRVAQWKANLVAVYNAVEESGMGFTHAYFPVYEFDEHVFARGWAFARKGEGFVGLTCSQGFEQIKHGPGAFRELRSAGRTNVWLCVMGNLSTYQGFRKFQKQCMAMKPVWSELGVQFSSPQKEEISFGWDGPLQVNGEVQPLSDFKLIENPYCTADLGNKQMDIQYGEILMRLNFE